jgi:hypothetical protein
MKPHRQLSGPTICPICRGSGSLPEPKPQRKDERDTRREMARVLREHGYSLRQIAGLVGYKSPRSVALACEE